MDVNESQKSEKKNCTVKATTYKITVVTQTKEAKVKSM